MPFSHNRICPICGKPSTINISSHLLEVHGFKGAGRKPWLRKTKYQGITVYHDDTLTYPALKERSRCALKKTNLCQFQN